MTSSSDMLEDPSRCSDVLKDSSRCNDMRVGGTQGLTLDTTEAFPLGNQQVSKKLFSWNPETNISKYFFKPISPFSLYKLERNNRKREGKGGKIGKEGTEEREDLKFKVISLIFLVLFGTHSKYSTESLPKLKILPKACKRFLFINNTKTESLAREEGESCLAGLCVDQSHLGDCGTTPT